MIVDTLFTIDTAILGFFISLAQVGNYAIALKVTSILMLVPRQVARSLQVVLANYEKESARANAINTYFKANLLLTLGQLLFILVAGRWLILALFGVGVDIQSVLHYTVLLTVAVTLLSLGMPLISIINTFLSLKHAFFFVFVPSFLMGLLAFIAGAFLAGAEGMAYANIFTFGLLLGGLLLYIRRFYPFPVRMTLITVEERQLLRELIRGF
jgi:O-antigen/teichoic acid export membrane protein